jgi:hypothetical protein
MAREALVPPDHVAQIDEAGLSQNAGTATFASVRMARNSTRVPRLGPAAE